MGTVQFNGVKANVLGILGCLGKGRNHVIDVLLSHTLDQHLAIFLLFHRAVAGHITVRLGAETTDVADVPQLRCNLATGGVHRINNLLPAGQRVFTVEVGHVRVAVGRRVINHGAFGNDQAHTGFGTATVVIDHGLIRHALGREVTSHRRHHDAIGQRQIAQGEGLEQRGYGCGHTYSPERD